MAKIGQARLRLTPLEAQILQWWLEAWQPNPVSPLSLFPIDNAEATLNAEIATANRLRDQFFQVVRRKRRSTQEATILVNRDDIRWVVNQVTDRRGMFGRIVPARSYLPAFLREKLGEAVGKRKGRPTLSRAAVKAGGTGTDKRHKKRLRARLKRDRLIDDWFERRRQAGQPTGLFAMPDPDDPYPKLP
jgi:hypothetical protein